MRAECGWARWPSDERIPAEVAIKGEPLDAGESVLSGKTWRVFEVAGATYRLWDGEPWAIRVSWDRLDW